MAVCSALHATSAACLQTLQLLSAAARAAMSISAGVTACTLDKASGEAAAMARKALQASVRLSQDPREPSAPRAEMATDTYLCLCTHMLTHMLTHMSTHTQFSSYMYIYIYIII